MRMVGIALVSAVWVLGAAAGAFGQTIHQTMEGGMDLEISHPGQVIAGREAGIAILIKNNGWEDKQDISLEFSSQDEKLAASPARLSIDKLSQGGSHGSSVAVIVAGDANPGMNFLNVRYSQVLVADNQTPQDATFRDIAIPIEVKEEPDITIYTKAPESIFAAAEFPIEVSILSDDIDIRDVRVKISPPDDVEFRGQTLHTFSTIKKDSPITITSRIVTQAQEVNTEYRLPFEVMVEYVDDVGEQKTDTKTVSMVLRPRVFMELTTEGGIWIGDFFIAPYVSLGTIIGIPAGALITLMIRRRGSRPRRRRNK